MADTATIACRPLSPEDRPFSDALLRAQWGDSVVSLGRVHDPFALPGFIAWAGGERVGMATYAIDDGELEVVTLASTGAARGVGRALMETLFAHARAEACSRVWLVTTNDNLRAMGFYQVIGMTIAAVRPGAITEARRTLKPEIPELGNDGIPIRDEIEFEMVF